MTSYTPSEPDLDADPRVQRSRARLIDAATTLLVESGARAVTVDAVAERSGVAKSTLYRHWPSIESLLIEVLRCAMPKPPPAEASDSFESSLRQQVRQMATMLADPQWIRIFPEVIALRLQHSDIEHITSADRAKQEAHLASILSLGTTEGCVPPDLDSYVVAVTLFGPMVLCSLFGDDDRIEEVGNYTVDRFLASYCS